MAVMPWERLPLSVVRYGNRPRTPEEAMLGLAPVILPQAEAILEPANRRFVSEAPPVHDKQSIGQVRVSHPQVQVTAIIIDIRLQAIAEPKDCRDCHERIVPVGASLDLAAPVLGPGRIRVDDAILGTFVEFHP